MKVCYLINQLAPGGAPTLLLDIVRNAADDISFTICFVEGDDSLVSDFQNEGAEVVDFRAEFKFDPRALWRMYLFFRSRQFDIVHCHLPYSQFLGRVFSKLGGISKVVSTQHNVVSNYHPVTRTLERYSRPLDTVTIAVSEGVEKSFRGDSKSYPEMEDGWTTIHNGISIREFRQGVERAESDDLRKEHDLTSETVFLNVGRYTEPKSQHTLVKAMQTVVDHDDDVFLFVVGWGPRAEELRSLAASYGVEDYVCITGKVPEVEPYYQISDVFVMSSIREGLPIALTEAMASGLPIVATDIPGVREVVREGNTGLLVEPESPNELGDYMVEIKSARDLDSMAERSFKTGLDEFNIRRTVEDHERLYREIVD